MRPTRAAAAQRLLRTKGGAAFLGVTVLVIGFLALIHRGVAVAQVDLNDGGVWVTNNGQRLIAHLNYPSRTLDGGATAVSSSFDVSQNGNDVVLDDGAGKSVAVVNPALYTIGTPVALGDNLAGDQGGSTFAVLDSDRGRIWAFATSELAGFTRQTPPIAVDRKASRLAVDSDGDVLVLNSDGAVTRYTRSGLSWTSSGVGHISGYTPDAADQLTTVGDRLVVLDSHGVVRTTGGTSDVGSGAVLQQAGPSSGTVAVAVNDAVLAVPMGGGTPARRTVSGTGTPAPPAVLDGCVYSAWAGSGQYLRDCDGTARDQARRVPQLASARTLAFRVNRTVIVLNNVDNGDVFLPNDNMQLVNNWQDIAKQIKEQKNDKDSTTTIETNTPPVRTKQNHPPVANDDSFGVRPGRSTTLPVLNNDTDPDGDILVADPPAHSPSLGHVAQAAEGSALQITVPSTATGSTRFTYTADDGRGGTAQASVAVAVHPLSQNAAPVETKVATLTVEQRADVQYNALPDWVDPDGDAIYLKSAVGPAGLEVKVRADGLLTVHDLGTAAIGKKEITVVVSDGQADGTGKVIVNLKPRDNEPPVANADHVTALRGRSIVVKPLDNDTDPGDEQLRLTKVDAGSSGTRVVPNYAGGTFTFQSSVTGTQYINYSVTDGPSIASSWVRVDVVDPPKGGAPPVAENDVALLPAAQSVTIYPLTNDYDPNDGVLVLSSVHADTQSGLDVAVINYSQLRITATRGLVGPKSFAYTITNGTGTATAQVTVVPLPPVSTAQPPVAQNDAATVRAGDIVTVPVLDNDQSPSGSTLRVEPKLRVDGKSLGTVFVSQNTVRLLAGAAAGQMRVTYTVFDSYNNYTSAVVVFTITPRRGRNSPPSPTPLIARVTAGKSVTIPVPVYGVDVDGDSVTLTGPASSPTKGLVDQQGATLVYTASATAVGTDHFTYRVVDALGAAGVGEVDIGIAPPAQSDQNPIAIPDNVIARTGRELAIPVLANDLDPDGDPLSIVPGSVQPVDSSTTTTTTVVTGHVDLTTPTRPATLRYYYDVSDGRGGKDRGVLTVTVQTDAPLLPPVAVDDTVTPAAVNGKSAVTVDVLANDTDPDGDYRKLTVTTSTPGVTVGVGGKLTILLRTTRQLILYTDTDEDHLTGDAVVVVPSSADDPPRLRSGAAVQVRAGASIELPLSKYVVVRSGHSPRITFGARVSSAAGYSGPLVKNPQTLVFTALRTFSGTTGITFEVTDGKSAEDPAGLTATLTLPIEVLAAAGRPPVFQPATVSVAAGEAATKVDLHEMAHEVDPGSGKRLTFTIGAAPAGIAASLSGSTLSVSAPANTKPGSFFLLPATVTDGATKPVRAQIPIRIVASTRPLMTVRAAEIANASAGKVSTIDIARYVTNPFADEGKPIALVGKPSTYNNAGTVTASGTTLSITPKADFHGQMTVTYTVEDATKIVSRYVEGTVNVTVRDRPDAPTNVDASTDASRSAEVSWTPPANNGAQISGYTVSWTPHGAGSLGAGSPGSHPCGQVTDCTITDLTNDVPYTFTVVATNEVGPSKPSAPSREVRPDVRPDAPALPTTTFGDSAMTVNWIRPHSDGSAVTNYSVQISGSSAAPFEVDNVTATTYVWQDLTNGTSYQFRVQAHSKAEQPSDWSPWSVADFPAGKPGPVAQPTVQNNANGNPPPSIQVNWTAPDANGDPALTYEVLETDESTPFWTGTDLSTLRSFSSTSDQDKTFEVRASNKAGDGPWSPASAPVRAFQAPGPVQNLHVTPTGQNNTVQVSFSAANGNGALPDEITYQWQSGDQNGQLPAGGGTIQNAVFQNGVDVPIQVWATSKVRDQSVDGQHNGTTVNAYGPPTMPSVTANGNVNNVTLCWDGANAGNGRAITQIEIRITKNGALDTDVGASRTDCTTRGDGRNQNWAITARARTDDGGYGPWSAAASASTWGNPTFTVQGTRTRCTVHKGCEYVQITVNSFNPNSTAYCYAGGVGEPDWKSNVSTDGAGNGGPVGDGVLNDTPGSPQAFSKGTFTAGQDAGGLTCVQR